MWLLPSENRREVRYNRRSGGFFERLCPLGLACGNSGCQNTDPNCRPWGINSLVRVVFL